MITATIVITTRNRREEAMRAIASALAQRGAACEVLVIDDASGDGTASRVVNAFPGARVIARTERVGLIVNRNLGFREAKGRYVFSLDDDAYFTKPDIVASVVAQFEREPALGAIAIPYIEPSSRLSQSSVVSPMRTKPGDDLRSFSGCAHAIRREAALALGGYRDYFVHQGEERDLSLRMRAAGWRIVCGDCGPIVHMVSPERDGVRISRYGIRNQILFEALNAPAAVLPCRLARSIAGALAYRFSWRTTPQKLGAIGAGLAQSARRIADRRPVPRATYLAFRALPYHGPEHWDGVLPPPCHTVREVA